MALVLMIQLMALGGVAAAEREKEEEDPPPVLEVEGGEKVVRPPPEEEAPAPFLSDRFQAGARTVIPREKFGETQKTVADVLDEVPGLTLTRTGDGLSPARVRIRGSRSDQVLILIDGVPMGGAGNQAAARRREGRSGPDLAAISLARVESIEVIRGAASGLYGPGAAAGVIHIRTRRPREPQLTLAGTLGNSRFREGDLLWDQPLDQEGSAPKQSISLHLNYRKTEGNYIVFDPEAGESTTKTPSEADFCTVPQGDGFVERRCNEKEVATLEMDWYRGERGKVSFFVEDYQRDGLGGIENPSRFGREEQRRYRFGYRDGISLSGESGKEETPDLLGWNINLERLSNKRTQNRLSNQESDRAAFDEDMGVGDLYWEFWSGRHQFKLGTGLGRQKLADKNFSENRTTFSLHAAWTQHRDGGTLEAGARHDRLSHLGGKTTFRTALSETLVGGMGVKASTGTGYRPPTLYEMFDPGAFGDSAANPDLQPETSVSRDGGIFWQWGEWLYTEALYFRQDTKNNINFIDAPGPPIKFRPENLERIRSTGVETTVNLRAWGGLTVDLSWTRTKAIILAAENPKVIGNKVPGVPDRRFTASVAWRQGGWHVWTQIRHSGNRFVDVENSISLLAFTVIDAGLTVPLGRHFEVGIEGRNLTNETYSEKDNFPPPGRQGFFTLRWRLYEKKRPNEPGLP